MNVRDQQAFPTSIAVSPQDEVVHGPEGLTKREYFAGLAMQNLQNVLLRKSNLNIMEQLKQDLGLDDGPKVIAACAVKQADALLEELAK